MKFTMKTINTSIRSYMYYVAFGIMVISMTIFAFSTTVLADDEGDSGSDGSYFSNDTWESVTYGDSLGSGSQGLGDYVYQYSNPQAWNSVTYGDSLGSGAYGIENYIYLSSLPQTWESNIYNDSVYNGTAGAGCCTESTYVPQSWDSSVYNDSVYNGTVGNGCCTEYSSVAQTWESNIYNDSVYNGTVGTGCCDVTTYQPTTYTPTTYAATTVYEPTTYTPATYSYTPVTYNTYTPTTYTYTPTTYTPITYTYTPTTYSTPTYTYTPTTYTPTTYTYNPTTYTYTPVVYDTVDMPSCDSFTASDYFVNDNDTVTLTWRTSDATGVYINKGVGTVSLDGTKRVTITDDITYELIASNGQTSVNCSVTIEIDDDDTDTRAPHCELTASDRNIEEGDDVRLSWDNLRTDDIVIEDGRGRTIVNTRTGSTYDADKDSITVEPTRTTTYTLTAKNGSREDECRVTVTVDEDDDTTTTEIPRCELSASDRNIEEGDEVKLSWDNVRTDDIVLRDNHGDTLVNTKSGGKYDADKDSITVEPDETTTYTLTAKNGSREDKCTVKVTVDEDKKTTKSSEAPRCVLTVSDTNISRGERVTLSWKNERTDRLIIKDNHGREILDSKDDKKINEDKDGVVVQPTQSTTYTLTAKNGSKDRDCTVKVAVGGDVSVTSIRTQDGIPLNQVPYTGFDASDMLVMIFYSGIGIWVSIMGYGFWMKRKETLALAENTSIHNF